MHLPFFSDDETQPARSKRFVYNADSTCGTIAYCSLGVHNWEFVPNTTLANDPRCSKSGVILSLCFNITLSLLIMFGNFMIIYIMSTVQKFRNAQGVFKVCLAMFDFLVGAVSMPTTIYNNIKIMLTPLGESYLSFLQFDTNSPTSLVIGMLFSTCISGSLFSLLSLSIDRMLAVHWPFKYSQGKLLTRGRAIVITVGIWFLSIILGLLAAGDGERYDYDLDYMTLNYMLEVKINPLRRPLVLCFPADLRHGVFYLVIVFMIPYMFVVLATVVTWLLFWWNRKQKLKKKRKPRVQTVTEGTANQETKTDATAVKAKSQKKLKKKNRDIVLSEEDKEMEKMTKIIVMMVASFTACVLPFLAVQASSLSPDEEELEYLKKYNRRIENRCQPILYMCVLELLYLNSLCNFLIYSLRNESFKEEVKKALKAFAGLFIRQ